MSTHSERQRRSWGRQNTFVGMRDTGKTVRTLISVMDRGHVRIGVNHRRDTHHHEHKHLCERREEVGAHDKDNKFSDHRACSMRHSENIGNMNQ
jgi:formylmethanofuran dehydrogenase subunit E